MKINPGVYCVIFLLFSACAEDKTLNPLEKRLSGRWIEYNSEKFYLLTDHSFKDPRADGSILKSDRWHAEDNKLYLNYSISFLGWLSSAFQKSTRLNIKNLTDSTMTLEKPATESDTASLSTLRKAKHNGKYITE